MGIALSVIMPAARAFRRSTDPHPPLPGVAHLRRRQRRPGCSACCAAATGDGWTGPKWRSSRSGSPRCTAAVTASRSSTAPSRCASRSSPPASRPKTRSSSRPTPSSRPRRPCSRRTPSRCSPTSISIPSISIRRRSRPRSRRARGPSSRCISPGSRPTWTRSCALARRPRTSSSSRTPPTRTARRTADRPAGSLGHIASFSFQSSKNLTAGEGGIITTNDDALAAACRSIHNCGRVPDGVWYEHHVVSGNYRLGEFQGAVLNCQLDRLEEQARYARPQRPAPRLAAGGAAWSSSAEAPRRMHAAQPSPLHAADRSGGIRCASRGRARRARRPKAFRAPPATATRCPTSRSSATRRSGRSCRRPPPGSTTRVTLPEQRSDLPRAGPLARTEPAARAGARTSTTSPAPSRRCTRTVAS